jgi:hypothetical protein
VIARHQVNPGEDRGKWLQVMLPLGVSVQMLGLGRRPSHEANGFVCNGMAYKLQQERRFAGCQWRVWMTGDGAVAYRPRHSAFSSGGFRFFRRGTMTIVVRRATQFTYLSPVFGGKAGEAFSLLFDRLIKKSS